MTKMAAMPIYGKRYLKTFLPWNQSNDFNETWYLASVTPAHYSLFKLLPWVDRDLFFRQGQISQLRLLYRKNVTVMDSLEIIAACDLEIG